MSPKALRHQIPFQITGFQVADDIAVNDDVKWGTAGSEFIADEQEILDHRNRIVQLVSLLKGDLELLEPCHHGCQQHDGDERDQFWPLGKLGDVLAHRANVDLACTVEREFLCRQNEHKGRKGRNAQEIDEE